MLNGIKNMINQKLAIQEAADAILRESCNMDIDDLIVLGEDSEMENPVIEEDDDVTDDIPMDKEDSPESLPGDDNNDEGEDEDDEDSPAGTDNDPGESDDIMNSEIDMDIPTPVGRQTGEPVNDDIGDLMQMEIDLTSNTMSNLLPIPPSNADEAIISDDIGTQHVGSGFGESVYSNNDGKIPGSKDEEWNLHSSIEKSSSSKQETKEKYFNALFGKDLKSVELESIPDKIPVKIGNTVFDFETKIGRGYDNSKSSDSVPAAAYLYQINKDIICNKIGDLLGKRLLSLIGEKWVEDPEYYGGDEPSDDIDDNLQRFRFKPEKAYFNMYGHIGFAMSSDIDPEHGVGFTVWPNMRISVGNSQADIFESAITGDTGIEESSKNLICILDNDKTFVKMKDVITAFASDMKPLTMLATLFSDFNAFTSKYPDVLRDCVTKDNYKTHKYLVLSVIDILECCKCVQEVDWKVEKSDFIWSINNIAKTYGFKHGVKSDDLSTEHGGEELMYEFNQKAKDRINVYDIEIDSDSYVLCLYKKDKVNKLKKVLDKAGMKLRSISKSKDGKLVLESVEEFTEGISLAGGMEGDNEGSDGAAPEEDVSSDPAPDTAGESDGKENSVTAAVRDKVNESEIEEPSSTGSSSSSATTKEELLKKLGSITKNLEDAKKAVMDVIN